MINSFRIFGALALMAAQVGARKLARLINLPYANDFEFHLRANWCRTEDGALIQDDRGWVQHIFIYGIDVWGIWSLAPERFYDGGGITYVLLTSNEQTGPSRDQLILRHKEEKERFDEEARRYYEEEQRNGEDVGFREWCSKLEQDINAKESGGTDLQPESTIPTPE